MIRCGFSQVELRSFSDICKEKMISITIRVKAYDFIGFDELTHFTLTQYEYLKSRNRPMGPGTRVYIRATANPDGKGMGWVKARFITPAPPETTMWEVKQSYGTRWKSNRDKA